MCDKDPIVYKNMTEFVELKKKFYIRIHKFFVKSKLFKIRRQKLSIKDFESIAIIGRGAFGEVRLCRSKNGEVVAIKKMNK